MKYAELSATAQACVAVRDCGVLRVKNNAGSARFRDALVDGLVRVIRAHRMFLDLTLTDAGKRLLQSVGVA